MKNSLRRFIETTAREIDYLESESSHYVPWNIVLKAEEGDFTVMDILRKYRQMKEEEENN